MVKAERKIIVINFLQSKPVREERISEWGIDFSIREHCIGWDFELAEKLLKTYDGHVDAFALSGIPKRLTDGTSKINHPAYLRLIRRVIKTSVYSADDIRDFFSEWTLKRLLQDHPQAFVGKKALFQFGLASAALKPMADAGATITTADPLILSNLPLALRGMGQVRTFFKMIKGVLTLTGMHDFKPTDTVINPTKFALLKKWILECDIFLTFGSLVSQLPSYDELNGKMVITDFVDPETRKKLVAAGVGSILELLPEDSRIKPSEIRSFSVLAAMIDQKRVIDDSPLDLPEYLLKWFEQNEIKPNRLKSATGFKRKCAFIIHALTQEDLWKVRGAGILGNAPAPIKRLVEKSASKLPCFYLGQATGFVSALNGQEVDCDIYGLAATPKEILGMREEFLYDRLVKCVELAKSRGASIVGLGAYTKVAGDAGVTVSKRASIPVTNGNSYSAATTLWAARQMVEKLDLISRERVGHRFKAKATIIGATGSIGRVSSMLVSLVFQEVALVATRPDKLLELREEILALSPGIKVTVTTQASREIIDSDLIVTATSSQSAQSVLDISVVKPGAVICDCSRPLDISPEQAASRPDVLVIESGEVLMPGDPKFTVDIGLPPPSVYACTAETILLAMEGRYESFSLSKQLSLERVKEIYKIGVKHGARLSEIRGPEGLITEARIDECRRAATERLKSWEIGVGLKVSLADSSASASVKAAVGEGVAG